MATESNTKVLYHVTEEGINKWEAAYLAAGEKIPYDDIDGVPQEFVHGPGSYECVDGAWIKVSK